MFAPMDTDTDTHTLAGRMDMRDYYGAFTAYAGSHHTGDEEHDRHLDLKVGHSRNVFRHARALAEAEEAFAAQPERARALALAALFHDLGRFMQYARYTTFNDAVSENHAHIAVREIQRLGLFRREEARVRHLALGAILLHNRFHIPENMDADARAVTEALRDADKLDIMRVMAGHLAGPGPADPVVALGVADSPEASPAIVAAVTERRLGLYGDMATTTDFTLLVCGWFYDLNYAWSRKVAASMGHLHTLAASLPRTEALAGFITRYTNELAAYADAPH